jgi:hypothetical protein
VLILKPFFQGWRSFNCSQSVGPLGLICDTDRARYVFFWSRSCNMMRLCLLYIPYVYTVYRYPGYVYPCYSSCPSCNSKTSCDWTSCYDDILFTRSTKSCYSLLQTALKGSALFLLLKQSHEWATHFT